MLRKLKKLIKKECLRTEHLMPNPFSSPYLLGGSYAHIRTKHLRVLAYPSQSQYNDPIQYRCWYNPTGKVKIVTNDDFTGSVLVGRYNTPIVRPFASSDYPVML